jgi:hypothetical protein
VGPSKPYEEILDGIETMQGGSRAAYRGEPEPKAIKPHDDNKHALVAIDDDDGPLDVEVVVEPIPGRRRTRSR